MTTRPAATSPRRSVELLAADIANQIAAGEVVVRPSSVVKELVENSLDASASQVRVDIAAGGTELVRVSDDGVGMSARDARLALERHATSKLRRIDELDDLGTLGFRGEALPAIASVSRFKLRTRCADDDEGLELVVTGGGPPHGAPVGCAPGTVVDVSELFFNVPARRKFLRATATESAHVGEVVQGAALAHPETTFSLYRDGRLSRQWLRAAGRRERAETCFPELELAGFAALRGPLGVEGYLGGPERARTGAGGLVFLVNGRPVQDRALARAVATAYGDRLEPGRYPIGVVYLDLPPGLVDVNVHPQKAEVRFAEPRAVADALRGAIATSVPWGRSASPGSARHEGFERDAARTRDPEPWAWIGGAARGTAPEFATPLAEPPQERPIAGPAQWLPAPTAATAAPDAATRPGPTLGAAPLAAPRAAGNLGDLRFVGIVADRLLACETRSELLLLDGHSYGAAVLAATLSAGLAQPSAALRRRLLPERLLFPARQAVSAAQRDMLARLVPACARIGVELSLPETALHPEVVLEALPRPLRHADPDAVLAALVVAAARGAESVVAILACGAAPRDGITPAQGTELVELAAALDLHAGAVVPGRAPCPHGTPVAGRLPLPLPVP